eukprot:scaffold34304_cov21-Tisochrysis_lutea.AAC.1
MQAPPYPSTAAAASGTDCCTPFLVSGTAPGSAAHGGADACSVPYSSKSRHELGMLYDEDQKGGWAQTGGTAGTTRGCASACLESCCSKMGTSWGRCVMTTRGSLGDNGNGDT